MNRKIPQLLVTIALIAGSIACPADDRPVTLEMNTLDDDLRAGGAVAFVLRMYDGVEQKTVLASGQSLADNSALRRTVGPTAPYQWSDVTEFGLAVKLHPGDGLLLQPDKWKVRLLLRGTDETCGARGVAAGAACFGVREASFTFQSNATQVTPLNVQVVRCSDDMQCNSDLFCANRTARCAVGEKGANPMGCVRLARPQPPCSAGQTCNGETRQCSASCQLEDKDSDGAAAIACGGTDCDDNDADRYPGNLEICDNRDRDEDCDPTTFGTKDGDGDGFVDAACRNIGSR